MKRYFIIYISIFLLLFIAVGCATMTDVLKGKDEGTSRSYDVTKDQAWEMAMTVLRWEDCETIEEHKSSGYMLTTIGVSLVSDGTLVGVWVEPDGEEKTNVTVVTKRKVQTNLATGLTETTFHDRFRQAVDIVKSGKTLPIEAPPYNW